MRWFVRFCTGAIIGGAGACAVAANWPDPNDPVAGSLLGIGGAAVGSVLGVLWAEWGERDS